MNYGYNSGHDESGRDNGHQLNFTIVFYIIYKIVK